jgi:hypothetical protein
MGEPLVVIGTCNICRGRDNVNSVILHLTSPRAIQTDLCSHCRRHATALEMVRAGRSVRIDRARDRVILGPRVTR